MEIQKAMKKGDLPSYAEFDHQESLKMRIEDYSSISNLDEFGISWIYASHNGEVMGRFMGISST